MADRAAQQAAAVDEFLCLLPRERRGDAWISRTPDWFGPIVFGGIGLMLTVRAGCLDAPAGARLHSIHAHFLRPVRGEKDIEFRTEVVKAGRSFALHLVTASHDGKPAIRMSCSFTADADGYVYDPSGIPGSPARSTTTHICTRRSSATPPTGPASVGVRCPSTVTPPA